MSRRRILAAALLGVVALVVPVAGHAQGAANVTAIAFTYVPPVVTIAEGDALFLTNFDLDVHTVTSVDDLFDSDISGVPTFGTEQVMGVSALEPGSYDFYCRFHPAVPTMSGRLIVQ